MKIFDVRIDESGRVETERKVSGFLEAPGFHRIATLNPEFLLLARDNERFQDVLNASDVNVIDGAGLAVAFWKSGRKFPGRYPGADLMRYICQEAERRHLGVFLAVRKDGLSGLQEVRCALQQLYPELLLDGCECAAESICDAASVHGSSIVLCNFGAPEQEYFLESLRDKPGNITLALGVGGSFDYLTGRLRRAPVWMRGAGLEWLWRLVLQPSRWRRIVRATLLFPWAVLVEKKSKNAYTEAISS